MYIKKKDREKAKSLDDYLKRVSVPKGFYEWLNKQKVYLAFKRKHNCKCSYCKKEFKSVSRINEYITCPGCKKKLLIKRYDIKHFEQKDFYSVIQEYEDGYVVRNFEIYSYQSLSDREKIENAVTEFGRQLVEENGHLDTYFIINTVKHNLGGYYYIQYWKQVSFWKPDEHLRIYSRFYPDNIDEILKPKYFSLKQFFEAEWVNIFDVINALVEEDHVFELLIKAKLYNLANDYYHYEPGTFEETFGVDRSYLPFMQEINITPTELDVLGEIKTKDVDMVRYFAEFGGYWTHQLLEYCKVEDLYKYKLKYKDYEIYTDYLEFAKQLGYDIKDKKILYPENLREKHDELLKQVEIKKNKSLNRKIHNQYKKIIKNKYQNKKYIIVPADSYESMLDESVQQDNCVRTYAEKVANGECDIYFMRLVKSPEKSLVTVEVRKNKVVQQRRKYNEDTTEEQKKFLREWQKKVLEV